MPGASRAALLALLVASGSPAVRTHAQSAPASPPAQEWRIAPEPRQRIPAPEALNTSSIFDISGVQVIADGSVAFADPGEFAVKVYASNGQLRTRVGRDGAGPGEYRTPHMLGYCGTPFLHVYDGALGRITMLDLDGRLQGTWRIGMSRRTPSPPMDIVCGADSTALLLGWTPDTDLPATAKALSYRGRVAMSLRRMASDGGTIDLGFVPGPERVRWPTTDGPQPLGKSTRIALGADQIYIGTGDSLFIDVRGLDGRRRTPLRLPFTQVRLDRTHIASFVERVIERNPNRSPAQLRARYADITFPANFPSHGAMFVDAVQRVWVERYRLPEEEASEWAVFDANGRLLARVRAPSRLRVLAATGTEVLGSYEDEDGVVMLQVHRVVR